MGGFVTEEEWNDPAFIPPHLLIMYLPTGWVIQNSVSSYSGLGLDDD